MTLGNQSMKKSEILQRLNQRMLILDGAIGTELQNRGMPSGVCPELWALENPDVMGSIHTGYRDAGADIIYTCTFGGNPFKLGEYGREDVEEINRDLAGLAKSSVDPDTLVAGDIGPSGLFIEPVGDLSFDEAVEAFARQARGLRDGGVDLFVIETQMDIQEARAALLGVRQVWDGFVMVSMTFEEHGRTLGGTTPEAALITLQSLGADAVGVNCSTGPEKMIPIIRNLKKIARVPLVAKPNAGMPLFKDGRTVFPMDADTFASFAHDFAEAGVNLLGGCCGTTTEHIQKMSGPAKELSVKPPTENSALLLSSGREALIARPDGPLRIIGERINPTGKKKLQAALKGGDFDHIMDMAREQADAGAALLDVNAGMPGIDEKETLLEIVKLLAPMSPLPLVIDSSDPEVVEAAVRLYPGRALINSVSGEKEKRKTILPLAKKYGAALIVLPLTDGELPATAERRIEIVEDLYAEAKELGFRKEDLLVDGLVMTVSSQPEAARETLETIRWCAREGFGTVVGLSNVSFGLPARGWLNGAFLTMAQGAGLTFAIANPGNQLLMDLKHAGDLLQGKDLRGEAYIRRFSETTGPAVVPVKRSDDPPEADLERGILNGEGKLVCESIDRALAAGGEPKVLLQKIMIPAILKVGEYYDQQKFFLPQLMASAEAMRKGFLLLQPRLEESGGAPDAGKILFATVQGDIHDIGKNIVVLMLKNYGFEVIDLGKDVAVSDIVAAAVEHQPDIVGLSALMTTTMVRMPDVIKALEEKGLKIPVMVGGAVVTPEWAENIGAHYSRDGVEAVRVAEKLLKL